ncbi:MAG: acyl-CoA dehydrogenase family protein [Alicyclobacillaceae bacterium]|nr:acyl-CoA dehydrogenase family protein [Alicyclobacillaceae bacterium]
MYPFTQEHEELRKVIRQFLQKEVVPHVEQWEAEQKIPRELLRKMGALGYFGLNIAEEYGGSGDNPLAEAVLHEEMGRINASGFANTVGVHIGIAMRPIYRFGTEEQKQKYVVPGVQGEKIGALAITEPGAGSDVAAVRTRAVRDGDHYVLSGNKIFITNGVYADFYVVAAKTSPEAGHRGMSLFIVDRDTPGFQVQRKLEKVGIHSSDTAELFFDDCRIPASQLLGEENKGFYLVMQNFQWERLMIALQTLGTAQAALDMAVEYAKTRQQFGGPLTQFQVIRHRLVDMAVEVAKARHLTYHALDLYTRGGDAVTETSMAKLVATEVAFLVTDMAVQIHGGYGYMHEYPIQRAWRDMRVTRIYGGTSEIMKEIIAKRMGLLP